MKLLIAEDDLIQMTVYEKIAVSLGDIEVRFCRDGTEVMEVMQAEAFDLFVLDIQLPGVDGFKIAEKIRLLPNGGLLPILFVSGSEAVPLEAFKTYHCYDYMEKPVGMKELANKIEGLIGYIEASQLAQKPEQGIEEEELLYLPASEGDLFINKNQLLFVESMERGCIFHTTKGKFIQAKMPLKKLLQEEDFQFLVQCHKAYALHCEKIFKITKRDYRMYEAHFLGIKEIAEISYKYYDRVMEVKKKGAKK